MIATFILNSMDTFNIIYLWLTLTKRENNLFKLISSVAIISILITIIDQLGLHFMVTYVIDIIVIKVIYKRNLKNIVFELLLILLIDMLLQLMLSLIIHKFVYDYIIEGFIIEFVIFIGVIIFSKINYLNKKFAFKHLNSNILIYFISTCSIYTIVLKFIWDYNYKVLYDNLFITITILTTLIISQILIYLYIANVIKEKEILKISNEYNQVINEIVEEIKQRQHDFVNYKNTIKGIIAVIDDKDVKATINNYMKVEEIYDNKINELIYINNVVIKSIIYRSICKAEKYNITFKYKIENNILDYILSFHEISNLLNNLLNNAFDEVLKDDCHKKNIEIEILNENKISHLIVKNQVVNPNDINLNEIFTRGYSTKNTTGTRGYGLYNLKQIVNLHKGYVKINIVSGQIIFDIYFNNSSG